MIKAENLRKNFKVRGGNFLALDGVSFDVPKGGFCSLLGPSGSGKTTVLKIVAGLERPDSGSFERGAVSPGVAPFSLVYQQNDLFPWLTVEDNIKLGLKHRYPRGGAQAAADSALKAVGLEGFNKFYPAQLSGGMQKRVSLARALSVKPELLLMDEPFAFLDFQARSGLQKLVAGLHAAGGNTVLFVTHDVQEAIKLSRKVIVLTASPGRVRAVVDIPFEYPRDLDALEGRADYHALISRINGLLSAETLKTDEMEKQRILGQAV